MKFLPWKEDKWFSREGDVLPFDKIEHLFAWYALTLVLFWLSSDFIISIFVSLLVGFGWEMKDGTKTYDGKNIQGFSWKDIIADVIGILLACITIYLK